MSGLNSKLRDLDSKSKSLAQELEVLLKEYSDIGSELKSMYMDEVNYSGTHDGLGVFGALNNTVSRNIGSLRNAFLLVKKMRGLSIYNISEIEEEIVNADISKLMK